MMHRALRLLVIVGAVLLVSAPAASAQEAPFCQTGQTPQFVFGFAALKAELGDFMGEPLDCEHATALGDTLQQTTTGIAFWIKDENIPTFTDGSRHFALTVEGLLTWEGTSASPPEDAVLVAGVTVEPEPELELEIEDQQELAIEQADELAEEQAEVLAEPELEPEVEVETEEE